MAKLADHKIVHDPVHGSIKVDDVILPLLGTLEVGRLRHIRQLGLASLVFPGANHTRLEHSLGTSTVARNIARTIGLDGDEQRLLAAAGLLHDVGHGPFSHVVEYVMHEATGLDHMDVTKRIITGDLDPIPDGERKALPEVPRVPDVLEEFGVEPKKVAELIDDKGPTSEVGQSRLPVQHGQAFFKTDRGYLKHIIHGIVDADQIDYLLRDSYYTGVAYGVIDLDRLMKTLTLYHNEVVIEKSGISAIEGLLVARMLMYSSVYFHKTTRIAEQMLSRAVELGAEELKGLAFMTDADLMKKLYAMGGLQRAVATRIKYRKLYKPAFMLYTNELTDPIKDRLLELSDHATKRECEKLLAHRLGLEDGEVIIDIPNKELLLSEPRLKKTAFKILDGSGRLHTLNAYSPLAKALQQRKVPDWVLCVSVPGEKREKAEDVAKRFLLE